ncbi:hypothetical protein [Actinomadura keratinilytica]|uniref:Uncharacterized protein n=1 Tax=Actinomadura keratinilytica TaxID=547461 RepID=A0ABP7Z6B7_9ACTN
MISAARRRRAIDAPRRSTTPAFAAALCTYQHARAAGNIASTEALVGRSASVRRAAGVRLRVPRRFLDGGRRAGLFLPVSGASAFSDAQPGVRRLLRPARWRFVDFTTDSRRDHAVTISAGELNETERNAAAGSADDVDLEIP